MQNHRYFLLSLLAIALVSCATPKNASLADAHNSYNSALAHPEIMNLAATEINQANDLLNQADAASDAGASDDTVDQFAYLAKQQAAIALETARQKTAEAEIAYAAAKYNQIRHVEQSTETDIAEQQLKQLNARKTDRGLMITLPCAYNAQLQSGSLRNVDKLADFLNQYPQYDVSVEGHTDNIGNHSVNREVSERRSYAVRMALIDKGVGSDRIRTHGYADEFPVAGNDTTTGRQLNRRVEIILSDENGNIFPHPKAGT